MRIYGGGDSVGDEGRLSKRQEPGEIESAFLSRKNTGLNFRKFPGTNLLKREQSREAYANFSLISYRQSPFQLISLPEFPEFSVEWFAYR